MDEYPSPAVGDVWKCNDPRGGPTFRVVDVDNTFGNGFATVVDAHTGKRSRQIRLNRFRPGRNGYTLVERDGKPVAVVTADKQPARPAAPTVAGRPAAERLLQQVRQQARIHADVSSEQVITVLRALADHTHMEAALQWRRDERFLSPAFSVATWMHSVADQIEQMNWAAEAGGPLLAKLSAASSETESGGTKELVEQLRPQLAVAAAERDRLLRANGEMAQVFAEQLDTITRFREGLATIAQYHPTWRGQRVNNAPNRSQLIDVAFRTLFPDGNSDDGGVGVDPTAQASENEGPRV